jgi:hypothetical protein
VRQKELAQKISQDDDAMGDDMPAEEAVQRAVRLVRDDKKAEAREILKAALVKDRDNPFAWAAMVQAVESRKEAIFCLKQVLRLKPGDPWATEYLRCLESAAAQSTPDLGRTLAPPPSANSASEAQATALAGKAAEPARQAPPVAGAPDRAGVPRSFSLFAISLWVLVGLLVVAVAIFAWYEFFASHPHDDEKALQAAREWTVAVYRNDYGTMESLVCGRYASRVREARQAATLVDIFAGPLGMDFSSEPPDTLEYEIVRIKGNQAHVRVTGFLDDLGDEFEGLLLDKSIYIMKRELGKWKWCGEE